MEIKLYYRKASFSLRFPLTLVVVYAVQAKRQQIETSCEKNASDRVQKTRVAQLISSNQSDIHKRF